MSSWMSGTNPKESSPSKILTTGRTPAKFSLEMTWKQSWKGGICERDISFYPKKRLSLRIKGLVTSLRELLDPFEEIEDLKADSLDVVELIMDLEQEFGIEIPDDELPKIRTVGDIVGYINKK